MVFGNNNIEEAKITGITPAVFIFKGRCELWPPYTLFPTCRLGYWTINLLCAFSTKTIKIIKPKKLILAAYDVWPNLIWRARSLDIHTTLFAARFSNNTSKFFPFIKNFYKNVYGSFSAIYTISESDNKLLSAILKKSTKVSH